jgi:hypothetical protein
MVENSIGVYESISVWMFKDSSLMGTFSLLPKPNYIDTSHIYVISSFTTNTMVSFNMPYFGDNTGSQCLLPFKFSYFGEDPWVLPEPFSLVLENGYA